MDSKCLPVILDKNNIIVAGHTRILAAKKLNIEEIPCIIADDLTEEQIKAFRLADNKLSELSGWDFEKLDIELEGLDLDMTEFGFDINSELKIDDFFTPAEIKEKEPKQIQCPYCGEYFTQ